LKLKLVKIQNDILGFDFRVEMQRIVKQKKGYLINFDYENKSGISDFLKIQVLCDEGVNFYFGKSGENMQ
jgi:hypothetical protein